MSIHLSIPASDLQIISKKRKDEPSVKLQRRYQCLWLLNEGYLKKDIAAILAVNIDTVTDWIKIYNKGGLPSLFKFHYEGRRPSSLDVIKDAIATIIKEEQISTIKALQQRLRTSFKIEVEHSWLYRYCKKNSIALIKRQD